MVSRHRRQWSARHGKRRPPSKQEQLHSAISTGLSDAAHGRSFLQPCAAGRGIASMPGQNKTVRISPGAMLLTRIFLRPPLQGQRCAPALPRRGFGHPYTPIFWRWRAGRRCSTATHRATALLGPISGMTNLHSQKVPLTLVPRSCSKASSLTFALAVYRLLVRYRCIPGCRSCRRLPASCRPGFATGGLSPAHAGDGEGVRSPGLSKSLRDLLANVNRLAAGSNHLGPGLGVFPQRLALPMPLVEAGDDGDLAGQIKENVLIFIVSCSSGY